MKFWNFFCYCWNLGHVCASNKHLKVRPCDAVQPVSGDVSRPIFKILFLFLLFSNFNFKLFHQLKFLEILFKTNLTVKGPSLSCTRRQLVVRRHPIFQPLTIFKPSFQLNAYFFFILFCIHNHTRTHNCTQHSCDR